MIRASALEGEVGKKHDGGKRADEVMSLFSKEPGGELNVHDIQCMWYELEHADAHLKRDELPEAFRLYWYVEKHFETISEDQYDFHFYSMRKNMVRAYMNLLQMEDRLLSSKHAQRAGIGMLKLLYRAYKNPEGKLISSEF